MYPSNGVDVHQRNKAEVISTYRLMGILRSY